MVIVAVVSATIFPPEADDLFERCDSHDLAIPAVDVDDQFGESASADGRLWRLRDDVCGEDHGWSLFVAWYVCHGPLFFREVEKVWAAMERAPFVGLMRHDAFNESPLIGGSFFVDFGETIVDEWAMNFRLVVDLLQDGLAVGPHDHSREFDFDGVDDSFEDLYAFFCSDEFEGRNGIMVQRFGRIERYDVTSGGDDVDENIAVFMLFHPEADGAKS